MGSLRVWVSYAADNSQQEGMLVQQLIGDLRKAGAFVVTDDAVPPGGQFQAALQRELSRCQWFLLVQTQQAVRSNRVLSAMNVAMVQAKHGLLRGVLRIVCPSSDAWEEPVRWSETMAYPYNGDYPRLRDKILLDLDLLRIDGYGIDGDAVERDVSNVATRWLVLDQEARVAQEYPTANPVASPVIQKTPAWSPGAQGYLAGNGDGSASWRSREKMRRTLSSFSPSLLFARLQKMLSQGKMGALIWGQAEPVLGDRPVPIRRPFLFSRRFWLYSAGVVLAIAIILLLPAQLPSIRGGTMPSPASKKGNMAPTSNVLAQDTFQRADQTLWGTASDGRAWGGDANTSPAFSIINGTGQIANTAGMLEALAGPVVGNVDVEVSVTANQFADDVDTMNIGAALRWRDTNDWYKALIDGNNFSIDRAVNGNTVIIDTMPFAAQGGTAYTIRFEAIGTTLQAKVWPSDQTEPPNWMLVISDATFAQGQAGVRVVMQDTTLINVLTFKETAL
jgi:hypothetical protein